MALETRPPTILRFGTYEVDLRAGELRKQGKRIRLQEQPFHVLTVLLQRPGDVVTREELRTQNWPEDTFVDFDNSLNTAINKLREALGDSADNPRFIETLPRRGYRFIAPVTGNDQMRSATAPTSSDTQVVVGLFARHKRAFLVVVFGSGLILAGLGYAGYRWRSASPSAAIDSLAVLPFTNVTADPNTDYLSDGLTESLIGSLSRLPNLTVRPRSSVFRYKAKDVDIQKAATDLQVGAVVTGRVTQHGDSLLITAELTDTRRNRSLWSEQYDRKLSDALSVQREISREIASRLREKLTGEQKSKLASGGTNDPEAYSLYLKGHYYWEKRTPEGLAKSKDYFQQAIEKDPGYALAYAGVADSYAVGNGGYLGLPPQEARPKAKAAAMKALEIDNSLAEAHTTLADCLLYYDWDFPESEREFKRAIEANPNYPTGHQWYSEYLGAMGRHEEAIAEAKRALELDPLSVAINGGLGSVLFFSRQYDQAIEQMQKTLQMDSNFAAAHWGLGDAYEQKKMYAEAVAERQKALSVEGDAPMAAAIGEAYKVSGYLGVEQRWREYFLEKRSHRGRGWAYQIAEFYSVLGKKDEALNWLEKAYAERNGGMPSLKIDPHFDALHSDPRFQSLVRRMNFTE